MYTPAIRLYFERGCLKSRDALSYLDAGRHIA